MIFFFKKRESKSGAVLIINTGQIGDLVIFSKILEHENILFPKANVFFLIDERFDELFKNFKGKTKIIHVNIKSYKYNIIYRINFNKYLSSLGISRVYNLTSIRPTWNDTLALAIGAIETYSFPNTWKTLVKALKKQTDNLYTEQISREYFNEYDRIHSLIQDFYSDKINALLERKNNFIFTTSSMTENFDIVLAPFASLHQKSLGKKQIQELINKLRSYKLFILCSKEQEKLLKEFEYDKNVKVGCGKYKLNELFPVINKSKIFIGIDSGLTHIALKTKAKVIAIIGQGDYGRYFPKPNDHETKYFYEKCEFANCEWHCKKDKPICIRNVKTYQIIKEVERILNNENP